MLRKNYKKQPDYHQSSETRDTIAWWDETKRISLRNS